MNSSVFALAGFGALIVLAGLWLALRRRRDLNEPIADLPDREFDARVSEAFRCQGYQLVDAVRSGPDAQSDLWLRRDRQTFVVSVRQRRSAKIGIDTLEAVHRAMTAHGAAGGFALTAGRFSREATAFAAASNIRLIEGPALQALLARTVVASCPAAASRSNPVR